MLAQLGINDFGSIGMLMFRATSDYPDVKMVTVHDPFQASRLHGPALQYNSVHGVSTHHYECWFLDVERLSTPHLLAMSRQISAFVGGIIFSSFSWILLRTIAS